MARRARRRHALRRHAIIAPCSGSHRADDTACAPRGLPWDCILGADIARDYKPKPGHWSLHRARLPPEEVMMWPRMMTTRGSTGAGLKHRFRTAPDRIRACSGQRTLCRARKWDVDRARYRDARQGAFRMSEADAIIDPLGLEPHPEGGWYRQTWDRGSRRRPRLGHRHLLPARSGPAQPLAQGGRRPRSGTSTPATRCTCGSAPQPRRARRWSCGSAPSDRGQQPQLDRAGGPLADRARARGLGLVGCTVSPGFSFEGFELAPRGFRHPPLITRDRCSPNARVDRAS